ncbi:MAG: nucleotidyltransferase family protein [Anaerolineae bacterium]|nr:nucleotidyltransferase family protein [Anaerolineae bacterium]
MTSDTSILQTPPTLEMLRVHRDEIIAIAQRHKAHNVRVFGSVARGDATVGSDIDLLVDFESGTSLFDLSGLWQDLTEFLGCQVEVLSDHPGMRDRLRKRIMRDVVLL